MNDQQLDLFTLPTPSMPVLDVSRCEVRTISYQTAANMVEKYHYAHRVPSIVIAIGMYVDDALAGCATWGPPAAPLGAIAVCGKDCAELVLELNRLFIHDWAGRNSESWLISRSFRLLPHPAILLSYADTGEGHTGYIYQATNWLYTGLSSPGGTSSRIEISGVRHSSKKFFDELGSQSKSVIREHYPGAVFYDRTRKHRYVYFLGSKKQRKELRAALKWPVLPYPKNGATR